MDETIQNAEAVKEARRYIDRAIGGIDTLHLGPLDYNIATTIDYLRTAAAILDDFERSRRR